MSSILDIAGHAGIDQATVESGTDGSETGDILDAAGNATHKYADTDDADVDSAEAATFIDTDLGRVDDAQVSLHTEDAALATGATVVEARPAVEGDFESAADFVEGTILLVLRDASDGTELADDTDISSLKLTYTATRQ